MSVSAVMMDERMVLLGCLSDVRLNGVWLPMDASENESAAAEFSVRSQNIGDGCSSNACLGILCEPGLVCHDLWRQAVCRCVTTTQPSVPSGSVNE